ncbi:glutathione S-transferase family protein [Oceanibaculum sp.]|uniref:glutathione S-transferase family protein n=1 Tax=Oceanibaculum sp. TaxID=1903597 RepID=UPI00258E6C11|nr:glutathione binding-like protein [Oceanibaculum sp.]MCH2396168.1 glutathione binding-like protein [Oceanibaculum sp.]
MYLLYGGPGNANLAPHAALQEAGLAEGTDYRFVKLDLKAGEHRKPDYLALNPHGVVPALVIEKDGSRQIVCEAAAILMHIADLYPASGLAPMPGSADRAAYYQWITYLTNTVQARFMNFYHSDYFIDGSAGQAAVKAKADTALKEHFAHIDATLAKHGPYLLGEAFSAADLFLFMLTRWGRNLSRPARDFPQVGKHFERVLARPAVRRTLAIEGIS